MKIFKYYILFFCLLCSAMGYADDGITTKSTDSDGNKYYTYTRSGVEVGTWQSFCLPMDIDIADLQACFDEIYIAYSGEELEFYNDLDDSPDLIKRRRESSTSSTITGISEKYSLETGYWTDEEEEETAVQRYCFAYSADGSNYYHYFIADFASESNLIIPQGMPFFAHVKSDASLTDGSLSIDGHIWSGETIMTGLVDKQFYVYNDQTLLTKDSSKEFHVIGSLSSTDTYSGTLYTITGDGTTTTTSRALEQYHAYLVGEDAVGILIYPKTCTVLESLESIDVTDPDPELHLTDTNPTLVTGTYKAGNIDYTRTVNNYYAGFCVPFDVDLSTMTDNFQDVYILSGFAIYNTTNSILTTFYKKFTETTLPAYTPFLAVMTTDNGTKKSQDVCLKSSSITTLTSTTDKDPVAMKVYDYDFIEGSLATTSTNYTVSYGGSLNTVNHPQSDGYYAANGKNGSWGYIDGALKAFREYIIITTLNSGTAKPTSVEISFEDETTLIKDVLVDNSDDAIYDLSGRKLQYENNNSLPKGIYIINGKKVVKK